MTGVPHATLLLDTARAAAGVGMRGPGSVPRQLVFRRGPHQLDVTTPQRSGRGAARFVWGQLLRDGAEPCVAATVAWLGAGGHVLAESATDEFGEFRLAADAPAESALLVVGDGDSAFLCQLPAEGAVA